MDKNKSPEEELKELRNKLEWSITTITSLRASLLDALSLLDTIAYEPDYLKRCPKELWEERTNFQKVLKISDQTLKELKPPIDPDDDYWALSGFA